MRSLLPSLLLLAVTTASAATPGVEAPWYLGEWRQTVNEGVCTGIRLKDQQGAEWGLGKTSAAWNGSTGQWEPRPAGPCTVTFWEPTRFSLSGDTVALKVSISPQPVKYRLDSQGHVVLGPNGARMERISTEAPAAPTPAEADQDLGGVGVNPSDGGRYELPGRVSVSPAGDWTYNASENRVAFAHGKREVVIFHAVPIAEMGTKMLEVGNSMKGMYDFRKMEVSRRFGEIDAQVFESETLHMSDGYSGARLFLIEACCGKALVGMAMAAGPSQGALWSDIDALLGSLRNSELAIDPLCAESGRQMKETMSTLTSSTFGETFRRRLVVAADALKAELIRRVGPDGPSAADQQWADCATYALAAADDIAKGVWQMNQGGYAQDWVSTGRFGYDQEQMLERVAQPGEVCVEWVRDRLGDEALTPLDRYLAERRKLDELKCPTQPVSGATGE